MNTIKRIEYWPADGSMMVLSVDDNGVAMQTKLTPKDAAGTVAVDVIQKHVDAYAATVDAGAAKQAMLDEIAGLDVDIANKKAELAALNAGKP